jgi:hypothetical protein
VCTNIFETLLSSAMSNGLLNNIFTPKTDFIHFLFTEH